MAAFARVVALRDAEARAFLDPALADALSAQSRAARSRRAASTDGGDAASRLRALAAPVAVAGATIAFALPILSEGAVAAVWEETAAGDGRRAPLPDAARPATTAIADLLRRRVLPHVARLFDGAKLCETGRAYALHYAPGADADGGRVFKFHRDDADVTLAVCVGDANERWAGGDLVYAAAPGRPGTPDGAAPTARHAHAAGVGVLHVGGSYHRVQPVTGGARGTLVLQAMRDDAAWKATFLGPDAD